MNAITRSLLLLVSVTAILVSSANAQVLATDDFSYNGLLIGNGWFVHSGLNTPPAANGSYATLEQDGPAPAIDCNLPHAARSATDMTYAKFRFRVPSGNPVDPDAAGLYFAHFKGTGTAFRARTGVLTPASGGDFVLAMNANSGDLGAGVQWAGDLSFDTWYTVVIRYDAATGEGRLWLDPAHVNSPSLSDSSASTGTIIDGFALRQSNDYRGFIHIDDVVVGGTFQDVFPSVAPVPTLGSWSIVAMVSGVLGIAALVVRKRRLVLV